MEQKYFVYQYLWRKRGSEYWSAANGLYCGTATGLFEHMTAQPEEICLTAVVEISATEYRRALKRGQLG
jgi:hypothetical protein